MFTIPFTQYKRPNGHKHSLTWECTSYEQEVKARALLEARASFDIEMLSDGTISMTCEVVGNDGDTHTLAHELCANGPDVVTSTERLVTSAHEQLLAGSNEV